MVHKSVCTELVRCMDFLTAVQLIVPVSRDDKAVRTVAAGRTEIERADKAQFSRRQPDIVHKRTAGVNIEPRMDVACLIGRVRTE